MSETTRCFVAIHLSPEAQAYVLELIASLSRRLEGAPVRWVGADNIHLTLRFMGHVKDSDVPAIESSLAAVAQSAPPFTLATGSFGGFPSLRSPSVLWVGLGGDIPALTGLQTAVEGAVAPFSPHEEKRRFSPHITIARCKGPVSVGPVPVREIAWQVESFELMQSRLSPKGSRYEVLGSFPLGRL